MGAFNEQNGDTVHTRPTSAYGCRKVFGPDTVSDPLLFAIDNVVFAIWGQFGFAVDVGDVGTSVWGSKLVKLNNQTKSATYLVQ